MKLLVAGVSHHTAPVEVRERLAFREEDLSAALLDLCGKPGIQEAVILSTCNRVEVAISTEDNCEAEDLIRGFFHQAKELDPAELGPQLYFLDGKRAIEHLFRVAASLDSMVIGEAQILGQLKAAYATARQAGTVGKLLEAVLTQSFSVAKRVRTETGIGQSAVSISYAAVELARKIFGSLEGRGVLLLGSGKMSQLAARHLKRAGMSHVFVTNRTEERARRMATEFSGTLVEYARWVSFLPEVDILIAASGADDYVLSSDDMQRVIAARRNRPAFLIDIAVPRCIDPAINALDNVFLYDIDDLQDVVKANRGERQKEAHKAEQIIGQEVERMLAHLRVREVTPTIVSLQEQLEEIRVAELARAERKLGALTQEQREAVEQMTRSLMNRIAHGPISELRRQAEKPDGAAMVETIRRVFQIHE